MVTLPVPVLVALFAVVVATVTDLRAFKIHNLLTLPLIVSGLIYHGVTGGPEQLMFSALGGLFGFGILFVLYLVGGMGGGDVKLMAGIGTWLGMPATFVLFLAASIAAGVYSLVVIIRSGRMRETLVNFQLMFHRAAAVGKHLVAEDRVEEIVQKEDRRSRVVPFGAMMAIGLIFLLVLARTVPLAPGSTLPPSTSVNEQLNGEERAGGVQ